MRKVAIILGSLAVVGLAYWGYLRMSGSTPLEPPVSLSEHELKPSGTTGDAQRIGQTVIQEAIQSRYINLDPVTKEVKRVFGFSRLLNPGSQSSRWQVEKPYIIFYESSFQCRVDADNGLFQVENAGSSASPRDGQLDGNVVIHLMPNPGSSLAETYLLLEDLLFSSERTELSTDGPVRMVSSQAELLGRGLVLLFNAQDGQVEYLHILDLESLRIKNFVGADKKTQTLTTPVEEPNASKEVAAAAATPEKTTEPKIPEDPSDAGNKNPLYQCIIDNNVMIRYGVQIVVAGADQVNIQNIARPKKDEPEPANESNLPPSSPTMAAEAPKTTTPPTAPTQQMEAPVPAAFAKSGPSDDSRDVIVTCDGGIVFQPMPTAEAAPSPTAMAVEMNGTPLRIEQADPKSPDKMLPVVQCSLLRYNTVTEVLRLFADDQLPAISLGGGPSAGRIETPGPVVWDRKANQAQIAGPGTMYMGQAEGVSTDSGQIAFAGQMDLFFADLPAQDSSLLLTAANLTGGMSAQLRGKSAMDTAADTAYFAFGPENALASARLEGSVRLASGAGRLETETATIAFASDETGTVQPSQFQTADSATLEMGDAASKQPPARFEAQKISYDLLTGSGRATGPVRFVFYQPADPNSNPLTPYWPVEITADGDTEFVAGANRQIETVIFNRNVRGVKTQQFAAYTQKDAFRSDTMVVKLGADTAGKTNIQQVTLRDGDVFAESIRTHETLKLAHTRLSCQQILYSMQPERFVATGPGQIELDNSKAEPTAPSDAKEEKGSVDLKGPCFAQIKGFDSIEWNSADRRIVADGKTNVLEVAYIPVVDGKPGNVIRAASGHVELDFSEDADGRTQLARLTAKDRVYFEEQGKHILEGYTLLYPAVEGSDWLSITGTEERPCMADGARVPYIHYNRTTGDLETRLSTIPGAVPVPPRK